MLPIEVPFLDTSDALIDAGLLCEWDSENREKISEALSRVVRTWVASRVSG